MSINWFEVQKALPPIKDFEDLVNRLQVSYSYPFVRTRFNFDMTGMVDYTGCGVGSDPRGRYNDYAARLTGIFNDLKGVGVRDTFDLATRTETRRKFEGFCAQSGLDALDIVAVLKYLVYWFIPGIKWLGGLVKPDPFLREEVRALGGVGVRSNLDMLQQGINAAGRKQLAGLSGLPEAVILEWVNRADLSRMPWASKATIANIMGAGYGSLARLAGAEPEQLYADFFRYGRSIGKNLKLGNEIENSHRIARIVPIVLEDE